MDEEEERVFSEALHDLRVAAEQIAGMGIEADLEIRENHLKVTVLNVEDDDGSVADLNFRYHLNLKEH